MSFPRYAEYKDSGVEWLGDVPAHWSLVRLKHHLARNDGGVWGDDPDGEEGTPVLRSTDQTVDGRWSIRDPAIRKLSPSEARFAHLRQGDLLVTKSSGSSRHIGKTTIVDAKLASEGLCYSNFMQRIRPDASLHPKLAWYILNNEIGRSQLDLLSNSTTGLANLNGSIIGNLNIVLPPGREQPEIVAFLDRKTGKIDALIEQQRRLIELLKEKRQAVISHAVTKGFDPNVPMKDSGVEWLGEVPAHWTVAALRWYAGIQGGLAKGKTYGADEPTSSRPYLRVANVQDGHLDLSIVHDVDVALSEASRYELRKGDVLMNEGGDSDKLGRGAVWQGEIDGCLHQNHVFAIRPNEQLSARWLSMFTRSDAARSYFYLYSKQSTNLASISSSNVMGCPIPIPRVEEQLEILDRLSGALERIDKLMNEAERAIALLQERRSALISAAVTGKIDVRGWSAVSEQDESELSMVAEQRAGYLAQDGAP